MTESFPSKVFTVEEVNRLIGTMETVMAEIERLGDQVERHTRQLQILDALWGPNFWTVRTQITSRSQSIRRGSIGP